MDFGKLSSRISIQQNVPTRDTNGAETESWSTIVTVWASKANTSGREFFSAQKVNAEVTTVYMIRYRSGIVPTMRILDGNSTYNILFVDNVEGKNTELKIAAKEVV